MEQVEIWKDVPGYNGEYQVSNLGNVRSYKTVGMGHTRQYRALKQHENNGYLRVNLYKRGGRTKCAFVHDLVAFAFLGIHDTPHEVNHIDMNRANNRVENLEWVTHSENMRKAAEVRRRIK